MQMFWINPLTWAFRAAVLNEFQSPEYDDACVVEVAEGEPCPQNLGEARRTTTCVGRTVLLC